MKKPVLISVLLLTLLMLTACGGLEVGKASEYLTDTEADVQMSIVYADAASAVYRVENQTGVTLSSGGPNVIDIEVLQNGVWHQIDVGERIFTAEALLIGDGETYDLETNWENSYGKLPKGQYRILKSFVKEETGAASFVLSAEFEVK